MNYQTDQKKFLYEEIAGYISEAINRGTIPCGSKLPSLRRMSGRFGCSVSVVMQAYEELERQGKTYAVEKSGYFATSPRSSLIPDPQNENHSLESEDARPLSIIGTIVEAGNNRDILPLGAGIPHESLLPLRALKQSLGRVLKGRADLLRVYTDEAGSFGLRKQIAVQMLKRGVSAGPSEILVTNGCTEALFLAVQACSSPGDVIAIESPVFLGIIRILDELKRRVIPVPTSSDRGMDLDILEDLLKKRTVKAVVISSCFQNPLGFSMTEDSKKRAVQLACEYNVPLIEDDIYSECSFSGETGRPLKSYDRSGSVIYCSSFSKTISPGLRIGWLMGGPFHGDCRQQKMAFSLGGSAVNQEALADFLESGRYTAHIRQFQKQIARQSGEMKQLILQHFPEGTAVTKPLGGFYFWVQLPFDTDTSEVFERALAEGISIVPGEAFSTRGRYRNCLRISYGSPVTDETRAGIQRLGQLTGRDHRYGR